MKKFPPPLPPGKGFDILLFELNVWRQHASMSRKMILMMSYGLWSAIPNGPVVDRPGRLVECQNSLSVTHNIAPFDLSVTVLEGEHGCTGSSEHLLLTGRWLRRTAFWPRPHQLFSSAKLLNQSMVINNCNRAINQSMYHVTLYYQSINHIRPKRIARSLIWI